MELSVLYLTGNLSHPEIHGQRPLQDAQAFEQVTELSRRLRSPFQCFTGHLAVGQKSLRNMYRSLVSHPSRVHSLEVLDRCPKLKAPRNHGAQCTVPHGESQSSGNPRKRSGGCMLRVASGVANESRTAVAAGKDDRMLASEKDDRMLSSENCKCCYLWRSLKDLCRYFRVTAPPSKSEEGREERPNNARKRQANQRTRQVFPLKNLKAAPLSPIPV